MRYAVFIILLNLLTGSVAAQQPPDMGGPPPDLRMQMEEARSNARTAIMNSLGADHRSKVAAIVDAFNRGDLSMCQAAENIDAVLSPAESAAAIAQAQNLRFLARRALPPPGAMASGDMPPPGVHITTSMSRHKPDAGEVVVMVSGLP